MEYWKTSRGGREAMFQAKPHLQTSRGGRGAMFILSTYMAQNTRQAKPHEMEYYQ